MNAPVARLQACPRCHARIVWLDGEPSPSLVAILERGTSKIVACTACVGRRPVAQGVPAPPPPAPSPPPVDPRPRRQIIAEEGAKVVELGLMALDVLERAANFWEKLKPRKGPR